MSSTLGKHHAQERLQLFADGRRSGLSLRRPCWPTTSSARGCPEVVASSIEGHRLGRAMVDEVLARAARARADGPDRWM